MRIQFLSLFATRVLAAVLQAAGFLILSRVASVTDVGVVGIVTSAVTFAALVTDFGIATSLSRSRARGQNEIVVGSLWVNDLTAALLAIVGAGVVAVLFSMHVIPFALVFLLVSLAMERNVETALSVFFADGNKVIPAVSILGRRVVGLASFVGLLVLGVDAVLAFCLGQFFGNVFGQVQKSYALRGVYREKYRRASVGTVMQGAWPFWLSSVLNQVRVLDTTIVGATLSTYVAGLYSAAQRIVGPLMLIPTSLAQVVMPHATRQNGRDAARTANKITLLFLLTYVPLVPVIVFADQLMGWLFGAPYSQAGLILVWSMLGLPFLALANPLTAILQGQGHERFIAANAAVFAAVMLAAMIGGALVFGAPGVAGAIGIVSALRCIVMLLEIRRRLSSGGRHRV